MTTNERTDIYKIAATIIRGQFDDVDDLDLPKNFGRRRRWRLKQKIDKHNDWLQSVAIKLKSVAEQETIINI